MIHVNQSINESVTFPDDGIRCTMIATLLKAISIVSYIGDNVMREY